MKIIIYMNILIFTYEYSKAKPYVMSHDRSSSIKLDFSHHCQVRKGGGTGLLISNNWKYLDYTPLCNHFSLESHAITVTAPVKLHVVVIYRPPGQLSTFLEELEGLLSSFPEDGWLFQHSFEQASCCKFPFTPSIF